MGHQRQESQARHEVKASMEWRAVVQECWSLLHLHLGFGHVCKGLQGTSADRCVPFHVCFTPSLLMIVIIFAAHTHICCPKNLIKFVSFLLQMRLRRQWLTRWCKASQMGALVNVWSIFDVVGFDVVSFWLMFLFKVKIDPETKGLQPRSWCIASVKACKCLGGTHSYVVRSRWQAACKVGAQWHGSSGDHRGWHWRSRRS